MGEGPAATVHGEVDAGIDAICQDLRAFLDVAPGEAAISADVHHHRGHIVGTDDLAAPRIAAIVMGYKKPTISPVDP